MDKKQKEVLTDVDMSVKEAMRVIGRVEGRVLFRVDKKKQLLGSLTDGDIRRWVLSGGSLTTSINRVYNKNPVTVPVSYDLKNVKRVMLQKRIQAIPVVDEAGSVADILFWDDVFGKASHHQGHRIHLPVVIMAGGRGTRLDPFTKVLPKPLIPIGDKTVLELIMDKYVEHGIHEFHLSINHKARMIRAYFEEKNPHYKIHYIEEKKPLGTAGSLKFLQGKVKGSLMVSNCDILIRADYRDIVEFHRAKDNDITIVGSFRHFTIPYGVCAIENGGTLIDIQEKPEYDFLVNTGMYIIKTGILKCIPRNQYFDFTDLIDTVRRKKGKIGVFPIDEKSWLDIGQWDEYQKAVKLLGQTV